MAISFVAIDMPYRKTSRRQDDGHLAANVIAGAPYSVAAATNIEGRQ